MAPQVQVVLIPNAAVYPAPAYATALGGSDTTLVDEYQVDSELPGFAGHATYAGEQLLTWVSVDQIEELLGPFGMFHAWFNLIPGTFPALDSRGKSVIEHRRPAQVMLMSTTGDGYPRLSGRSAPSNPSSSDGRSSPTAPSTCTSGSSTWLLRKLRDERLLE